MYFTFSKLIIVFLQLIFRLREFQNIIEKNMKTVDDVQDNNPNIIEIQKLNTITSQKFQETRKAMVIIIYL